MSNLLKLLINNVMAPSLVCGIYVIVKHTHRRFFEKVHSGYIHKVTHMLLYTVIWCIIIIPVEFISQTLSIYQVILVIHLGQQQNSFVY